MDAQRTERTLRAVQLQTAAMGAELFEIGLFKQEPADGEPAMLPRVWDTEALLRSVPWLRQQNLNGRNVFIRPIGEHSLSLVDDINVAAVERMKQTGFAPAAVVETSPGNFQAWLKHSGPLDRETGTAVAQALAKEFGGDTKAADWRHFGRLAGLTNRKTKHQDSVTGLYPFVKLIEAGGVVYPQSERFVAGVQAEITSRKLEKERMLGARGTSVNGHSAPLKSIESFRADPRYGADGTRIDFAFAVYALSRGVSPADVDSAIRSRDLSHKGIERRQHDYVTRTIQKAFVSLGKSLER